MKACDAIVQPGRDTDAEEREGHRTNARTPERPNDRTLERAGTTASGRARTGKRQGTYRKAALSAESFARIQTACGVCATGLSSHQHGRDRPTRTDGQQEIGGSGEGRGSAKEPIKGKVNHQPHPRSRVSRERQSPPHGRTTAVACRLEASWIGSRVL